MDTLLNDVLIDRRLFESVKAGNGNAFESLFHKYYAVLCNYAATYLDERVEVEDVVQEVFVYLWSQRESVVIQNSVKSYLYSAVKYIVLDVLKHRAVERSHSQLLTEFWEDLMRTTYSEEELFQLEQIRKVVDGLPAQCRIVFTMSCLDGKKYKEIAEELQISVNTVKSHVLKAYREIREHIVLTDKVSVLFFWFFRVYSVEYQSDIHL